MIRPIKTSIYLVIPIVFIALIAYFFIPKQSCNPLCFTSPKRTNPVSFLVVHHFTLPIDEMIKILNENKFSSHYIIDTEGKVTALVPEDEVAWHAGISFWHGTKSLNQYSIGIELQHPDFGQTPFPEKQITAFTKLAKGIIKRHNIPPENIVGHSDIAPDAKPDPGKAFPWEALAKQHIGLWYDINNADKMKKYSVKKLLDIIGYPTKGEDIVSSAYAFRRHFLPQQVAYEPDMIARGDAIYKARLVASSLPEKERELALKKVPRIHPDDDGTYLTDPLFIKTLRAVAYTYKQAREGKK